MPIAPYDPEAEDEDPAKMPAIDSLIEDILRGGDDLVSPRRQRPRSS